MLMRSAQGSKAAASLLLLALSINTAAVRIQALTKTVLSNPCQSHSGGGMTYLLMGARFGVSI